MEGIGDETHIVIAQRDSTSISIEEKLSDIPDAIRFLKEQIVCDHEIQAIGHRVVHGGELFSDSVVITERVLNGIEACSHLAPLHNPNSLAVIEAAQIIFDRIPQVASFDTSFHHTLPEHAFLYAIPYELYERHKIRRYGFHGISHRYVTQRYRDITGASDAETNIITLHLGNGCSATAVRAGCSVDTSMGMTPLDGLIMGTRCGDLDPAVLGALISLEEFSWRDLEAMLNERSGLLGISGSSSDMRVLEAKAENDSDRAASLAIEMFCYRARKYIGSYLAALGGAKALIFTGGIGANSPSIRKTICSGLEWFGLRLDDDKNACLIGREGCFTQNSARLSAYVIPTDEELLIARDAFRCLIGENRASQPSPLRVTPT